MMKMYYENKNKIIVENIKTRSKRKIYAQEIG